MANKERLLSRGRVIMDSDGNEVAQQAAVTLGQQTPANSLPVVLANAAGIPANAATFSANGLAYTAYATPTDLIGIRGSATKTVAILDMRIGINTTAAALQDIALVKRSVANTGGTGTGVGTAVPWDSAGGAATATVDVYTAAPTPGAAVGTLMNFPGTSSAPSTNPPNAVNLAGFAGIQSAMYPNLVNAVARPIILHGIAEALYWNFKGAALNAGFSAFWYISWAEW